MVERVDLSRLPQNHDSGSGIEVFMPDGKRLQVQNKHELDQIKEVMDVVNPNYEGMSKAVQGAINAQSNAHTITSTRSVLEKLPKKQPTDQALNALQKGALRKTVLVEEKSTNPSLLDRFLSLLGKGPLPSEKTKTVTVNKNANGKLKTENSKVKGGSKSTGASLSNSASAGVGFDSTSAVRSGTRNNGKNQASFAEGEGRVFVASQTATLSAYGSSKEPDVNLGNFDFQSEE